MKRLVGMLAGVSLLAMGVGLARADIIDPLHGAICPTAGTCSDTETGGHVLMPTNTGFGFDVSPNGGSGTLSIIILTPNNDGSFSTDSVTGNGFTSATSFGTSAGVWSTGSLAAFLGLSASPDNPIGAYLPLAQTLDAGATGFNVYVLHDTMSFTLPGPLSGPGSLPDEFALAGALPMGSFIDGFFQESDKDVATANSGALFVNTTAVAATPLPGALPMFVGGLGLLGLIKSRKRKQAASVFAAA